MSLSFTPASTPEFLSTLLTRPALSTPWAAYAAMLLALGLASLLGSATMVESASRQPYGPRRDRLLGLTQRVEHAASLAYLDRPAAWVGAFRQGDFGGGDRPSVLRSASAPAALPARSAVDAGKDAAVPPGAAPLDAALPSVAAPLDAALPSVAKPALVSLPPIRRPLSADAPLRIHVIGDSFAEPLALELQRLQSGGAPIAVSMDAHIATALTRPDYFDWPARVAETLNPPALDLAASSGAALPDAGIAAGLPETLVVVFAGNEGQNMFVDGELLLTGTREWASEYQLRAAHLMDLAGQAGVQIYWIGLPPMRDEPLAAAAREINRVLGESAATRPWVQLVETWSMFAGADGGFAMVVEDDRGESYPARRQDGVHWTRAATDRVAARTLAVIEAEWGSPSQAGATGLDEIEDRLAQRGKP